MDDTLSIIKNALIEDMPSGDITTDNLFHDEESTAHFIAKAPGVISGIDIAYETFKMVDPDINFVIIKPNASIVNKGDIIAVVSGYSRSILKAERVALNFLQRMSGIATLTRQFVLQTEGSKAKILDTRKTTPNLRTLEKRAVKDGGGVNHRMNLSEMVMIKDNHIKAAKTITNAVNIIKEKVSSDILVEVEVESIDQLKEALETKVDIIMLDNMSCDLMAECVKINQHRKKLEASGNMTLERVKEVALTGVDYISVGALTHSFDSLDISLKFQ